MADVHLSPREQDVLRASCAGLSGKQIAARYVLSEKTVSTYRLRMMKKTGCTTQAQLGVWAVRHGFVSEGQQ